jgi:6-pyruvoyltetrahydropterin/6-carboxytetrahydropterin synthase
MRYRIAKMWRFEAAHHLVGVAPAHKCGRPHGHGYRVEVVLEWSGDIAMRPQGWVMDYGELAPIGDWIAEHFDHRDLNEAFHELGYGALPTTAECLALVVWEQVLLVHPETALLLSAVRVSETDRTWAEVTA